MLYSPQKGSPQRGSPQKVSADTLLKSSEIVFRPLNYEKYGDLEAELTPDHIIEFLRSRAILYKENLLRSADKLQRDNEVNSQIIFQLEKLTIEKQHKLKSVIEKRRNEAEMIEVLRSQNAELEGKIHEEKEILAQKMEPIHQVEEEREVAEKEITSDLLKKVYKYFEGKSNPAVVYIFEALIGLMRNSKVADNKSVEIYLQKYEGFMLALDRIDIKKLNPVYCEEHLNRIREFDDVFSKKDFEIFRPFRNILEKLCKLSTLAQDEIVLEKSIGKREELIVKNKRDIEQKEIFLTQLDMTETLKEDLHYFENVQLKYFQTKRNRLAEELKLVNSQLDNFEEQYFAGI